MPLNEKNIFGFILNGFSMLNELAQASRLCRSTSGEHERDARAIKVFSFILTGFSVLILSVSGTNPDKYPEGDFHIMVIADTQTSSDPAKYRRLNELVDRTNNGEYPGVDLVLNAGDIVASVFKDIRNGDTVEFRLKNTVAAHDKFNIPYYLAMGNHDYKITTNRDSDAYFSKDEIEKMENIWRKYTKREPYYAITHKGWNFIILNSMRGRYLNKFFDGSQLDWFESQLKKGMPSILCFHHPLQTDHKRFWCKPKDLITNEKEPRFFELIKTYQNQIKGIFVGHGHIWQADVLLGTIPVQETASMADSDSIMYTIVGFDVKNEKITIAKKPVFKD